MCGNSSGICVMEWESSIFKNSRSSRNSLTRIPAPHTSATLPHVAQPKII